MFKLVRSEKFSMQIVNQIRARIEDGSLADGERLPTEAKLTESFGASRATIREALSALEILGLIEGRSGGKFVHSRRDDASGGIDVSEAARLLADDSAFDLFDARVVLEPDLAALAAERASPEEKRAIAEQLAKCEDVQRRAHGSTTAPGKAVEEYLEEDRGLHLLIGQGAHNRVLYRSFAAIHHVMHTSHWRLLKKKVVLDAAAMKRLNQEHRAVLDAIDAGNPRQARSLMGKHLEDLRDVLF